MSTSSRGRKRPTEIPSTIPIVKVGWEKLSLPPPPRKSEGLPLFLCCRHAVCCFYNATNVLVGVILRRQEGGGGSWNKKADEISRQKNSISKIQEIYKKKINNGATYGKSCTIYILSSWSRGSRLQAKQTNKMALNHILCCCCCFRIIRNLVIILLTLKSQFSFCFKK